MSGRMDPLMTDDEMLAAERKLAERRQRAEDYPLNIDNALSSNGVFEIYDQIMLSEPQSLIGAAVMLRVLLDPDLGIPSGLSDSDVPALQTILAVIEREIAAKGGAA